MTKDSPEPWRFDERMGIFAANETLVTGSYCDVHSMETPNDEDCRRIVACVNACRNISTELLEESTFQRTEWPGTATFVLCKNKTREA